MRPHQARRWRVAVATLAFASAVLSGPASAQQPETVGVRLVDAPSNRSDDPRARLYVVDHVAPGTTISRRIEIANNTREGRDVELYPGAAVVKDGTFTFGDGRAANELTRWITLDPAEVTLARSEKKLARVTITVPDDASPGERYAVVWAAVSSAAPSGGGIAAVNRVGVRVYLSVGPGGEPPSDFEITTFRAGRDNEGNPQVSATVRNTGGRALDLSGELRLDEGPGGLSAGPFEAKLGTTLGIGDIEPVLVTLDKALPAGPWKAKIKLRSGITEREAEATITFPAARGKAGGAVDTDESSDTDDGFLSGTNLVIAAVVLAAILLAVGRAVLRARRKP